MGTASAVLEPIISQEVYVVTLVRRSSLLDA
jgi:hypothetical protein